MKFRLLIGYFLIVHVAFVFILFRTDIPIRLAEKVGISEKKAPPDALIIEVMRGVHAQMDPVVPDGSVVFLGDSITMALPTSAIIGSGVNYGIGHQRSDQLIESMKNYRALDRAKAVVVTIGTNDLLQGRHEGIEIRYEKILESIPPSAKVIFNSVPPIGNPEFLSRKVSDSNVRYVADAARKVCSTTSRCQFIDVYGLMTDEDGPKDGVLLGDLTHLSPKGYEIFIGAMRRVIR